MTPPSQEFAELRALLDALCEESITAEQVRRLEELVLARPEAEAFYIQYMGLHADLVGCFGAPPAWQQAGERAGGGEGGETQKPRGRDPGLAPPPPRTSAPPARSRPRLFWGMLGLAAGVLLALAWALWPRPAAGPAPPEPEPEASDDTVAVLLQSPGARWEGAGPPARAGAPLAPGWLHLKSGFAHIEFYSGATVILEGPAEFKLVSRAEGYCERGRLRATVPPQAAGFTIGSPSVELVDRGTEFGLQVGADSRTEVHVFKGKVELYDPGADRDAPTHNELTTGHGVRVDGPGDAHPIAADPAPFKTAEDLEARWREELHLRQQTWQTASEGWRQDPALAIYYTFQDVEGAGRTLPDQAGDRRQPHDGAVVGCAWGAGRWPDRHGLEFKQVSDRVRLNVPGEFDALTLAAWVRVDALPNRFNSLLMTDGWEEAAPHWHISDAGRIELGVQGFNRKGGVHYRTPRVITPDRLGQWVHLAVVYDRAAGRVTHYVDGQEVRQEPVKLDIALRLGDAEVGNWNLGPRPHTNPVRYFSGCMDEFMLFSRALAGEEVEQLYEQGRPPS
jgi:hypothetical protein